MGLRKAGRFVTACAESALTRANSIIWICSTVLIIMNKDAKFI